MVASRGFTMKKALRLGRKNLLALIFFAFLYVVVSSQRSVEEIAQESTRNVMAAIAKNTSVLVSPDRSTSILEPSISKSCKNAGSMQMILFMFITSPENEDKRNAIRKVYKEGIPEWESTIIEHNPSYEFDETIKVLFFVGRSHDDGVNVRLKQEWKLHGDIIFDDFQESYLNLTLKTLRMLKWTQTNCPEARFLVKIDDDVHLNVPKLLTFLTDLDETMGAQLIAGHKYEQMRIDEDPSSKWFTPKFLWQGPFPDFVAGFLYVLGSQARADLYKFALKSSLFHLEDVFLTGMVRSKYLNVNVTDIPGIQTFFTVGLHWLNSCEINDVVVVHPMKASRISCWSQFSRKNFQCSLWPLLSYCS